MNQSRSSNAGALLIPYGLRDGRMWAPRQVPNGVACGCVCPACGNLLQAKNGGTKRRAHFAHHTDHDCSAGYESSIHLMAKQLICEDLHLMLPAWDGTAEMPNPLTVLDKRGGKLVGKRVKLPATDTRLITADAEVSLVDYRPDIVAKDRDGELLIEILVSHATTGVKARNVRSEGRRMIEIDLSRLTAEEAEDPDKFAALVLSSKTNRSWISYPQATEAWRAARSELMLRLAARNRKIDEDDQRREEQARRKAQKDQEREIRRDKFRTERREEYADDLRYLLEATKPEVIAAKYDMLRRRDESTAADLLAMIPERVHPALQSYSGPVWAHDAHHLLWQAAIYLRFIHGRAIGHPVSRMELGRWLRAAYGYDSALWRLFMAQWIGRKEARLSGYQKYSLSLWYFTDEENRAIPNFFECVNGLLDRLMVIGVLDIDADRNGDFIVVSEPESDCHSTSNTSLPASPMIDPLLDTGVDSYIERWISHTRLGIGIVRRRIVKGSPTYEICFDKSRSRTVWLGNPTDGTWRLLDDGVPPDSDSTPTVEIAHIP